jgi:hypothetical protein
MLSEKAHLALVDIRDCILLARGFVDGLSYEGVQGIATVTSFF